MIELKFNININATSEKVYSTMIDVNHFREWVSVFSPNSYFEGSWNKGEKIVYLSPDENGAIQGMISTIQENIPCKQIYIQPCGLVMNGIEVLEGEQVQGLEQTYEKYMSNQKGNVTELRIEVAVYNELEDYFNKTWPEALEML